MGINTIINETERGVLYADGQAVEWLTPGHHRRWGWFSTRHVERVDLRPGYSAATPELRRLAPPEAYDEVLVAPHEAAVLTVDGEPSAYLGPGRYMLWQLRAEVRAWTYDLRQARAPISEPFARVVPSSDLQTHLIGDAERGVLLRDGEVVDYLQPGRHRVWVRDHEVRVVRYPVGALSLVATPQTRAVIPPSDAEPLEVAAEHVAIVAEDGRPRLCLLPGSYQLWQVQARVTATVYATGSLRTQIPERSWSLVPAQVLTVHTLHPYQRGVLYVDGAFVEVLDAGRHALHCVDRVVEVVVVDMREQELQITGQELMTSDKVSLRVNLIVKFRVTDARRSVEGSVNLRDALYSEAQMAARRHVAGVNVDQLLEGRNEAAAAMRDQVHARAEVWGVEVLQVDLKDVVLPGDMKELLNQVIEAEKKAAAQVIMRREETSATRAQANTARMMENNPMLMRLKELDAIRDVAERVSNVTLIAGAEGLLERLRLSGPRDD